MSSTPLLRKPRTEQKAPTGKKIYGARCFLDAADLDSGINSVSQISPWAVWKTESDHIAMISELDYVIDVIKAATLPWASTATEVPLLSKLAILSKLETTLSASCGVPAKCLLMLAFEIEKFFPVVTTQADLQWLIDRYQSMMDLEFEGMTVDRWCKCKLLPHDPESQKRAITYEAKLEEFKGWICQQQMVVWTESKEKYGADSFRQHPTMAECFRKGMEKIVAAGHFECLLRVMFHFKMRTLPAIEKKAALKWSAFGPAFRDAMQECDLPEHAFNSPWIKEHFERVRDILLPQFQFKLCRLRGLLEGQAKTVDSLKAKILAGMVSAAVAGGQLAATYLTHMLQEPDATA